ncbi:MAG: hypothetical protein MRECE_14c001 [Mycoplasmataceae bacterium CE_OT135]|nr:MAG: hypothetical protein MRECE_14c001 [Mycoplasmataceae bacterium CE_OT135]
MKKWKPKTVKFASNLSTALYFLLLFFFPFFFFY